MSATKNFDFVTQMTRGFDKENPNHMRAAEHLLNEVGLSKPKAIVAMSNILDMTSQDAFMHDTSRGAWLSPVGLSRESEDLLIDLLGKRPVIDKHRTKGSRKLEKANEDLMRAKELCTKIQQVIPFLDVDDSERLDLLQRKYIAVVAPAHSVSNNRAFLMAEYLYFLDMLLFAHPTTRVLGSAILQAWIHQGRAHEQDQSYKDATLQRMVWFTRMHKGYVVGDPVCKDKVLLPPKYLRELGSMPGKAEPMAWDSQGDSNLAELLDLATSRCANINCRMANAGIKLLRCGACQKTYYCSKECQSAHWQLGHKQLCKSWRK